MERARASSSVALCMYRLRRVAGVVQTITATPRQLESLIRLSEALARMRLSETVEEQDAAEALRLMQASMLAQLPQLG